MSAFQLYRKTNSFYGNSGQLLAGGNLKFYLTGTATLKNVFAEKALSTNNGSTVTLDASGRPNVAIWGSGQYDVKLYDVDNVLQGQDTLVETEAGPTSTLPALIADQFLTNNGSAASWAAIKQIPDMTGSAGKILGTDGTLALWQAATGSVPATGVIVTATGFRIGTMLAQVGSGSFPASGTQSTNGSFTFGTAFNATALYVGIQFDGASMYLHSRIDSKSTTGFTASADSNIIGENVLAVQAFKYLAIGTVA